MSTWVRRDDDGELVNLAAAARVIVVAPGDYTAPGQGGHHVAAIFAGDGRRSEIVVLHHAEDAEDAQRILDGIGWQLFGDQPPTTRSATGSW